MSNYRRRSLLPIGEEVGWRNMPGGLAQNRKNNSIELSFQQPLNRSGSEINWCPLQRGRDGDEPSVNLINYKSVKKTSTTWPTERNTKMQSSRVCRSVTTVAWTTNISEEEANNGDRINSQLQKQLREHHAEMKNGARRRRIKSRVDWSERRDQISRGEVTVPNR